MLINCRFIPFNNQNILKQGVQGLQAFAFCVINVNDEHTKPRFRRKCRG